MPTDWLAGLGMGGWGWKVGGRMGMLGAAGRWVFFSIMCWGLITCLCSARGE